MHLLCLQLGNGTLSIIPVLEISNNDLKSITDCTNQVWALSDSFGKNNGT